MYSIECTQRLCEDQTPGLPSSYGWEYQGALKDLLKGLDCTQERCMSQHRGGLDEKLRCEMQQDCKMQENCNGHTAYQINAIFHQAVRRSKLWHEHRFLTSSYRFKRCQIKHVVGIVKRTWTPDAD